MHKEPTAIKLSDTDLKKFRTLWLEKFGIHLGKDDARKKLLTLVRQVEVTHRKVEDVGLQQLRK